MKSFMTRPFRPRLLLVTVAALFLTACGVTVGGSSWPNIVADGDVVFVAGGSQIYAVDVIAQRLLWSYPEEQSAAPVFAAPAVAGERLVFGDFGTQGGFLSPSVRVTIAALDGIDGRPSPVWSNDQVASDKIVAPLLQVDERIFVGTGDNQVLALDAANEGRLLWSFATANGIWAQPTYVDGLLLIASMDKTLYALDAESGDLVWQASFGGALPGKPVVAGDLVFVGSFDQQLHAVDLATGAERWQVATEDWVWAAPAAADGMVYFADIRGNVHAVNADDGQIAWSAQAPGGVIATPLLIDGVLYVATAGDPDVDVDEAVGELLALEAANGRVLWQQMAAGPVRAAPVQVDDFVVVALEAPDTLLQLFDRQTGASQWRFSPPSS